MKITLFDKLRLLARAYAVIPRLPSLRLALRTLFVPIDAVRYLEFAYFFKKVSASERRNKKILSVSSPHMLSYLLTPENHVTAANLDHREAAFFRTDGNIEFKTADATALSFGDASFDIVYSVSVIEHIYKNYSAAVREMFRVLKPGGLLYITCPIAAEHEEEWLDEDAYGVQAHDGERIFFQYRFSEEDIEILLATLSGYELIAQDIYWERLNGSYDCFMEKLRRNNRRKNKILKATYAAALNLYNGFKLMEKCPAAAIKAKRFGNIQLLLRKI